MTLEFPPRDAGPGIALIDGAGPGQPSWTYDQLAERAAAVANGLAVQGLVPGELVAVPERPGAQLVVMQHALAQTGAALLPVRQRPQDLAGPAPARR